VNLESTWPSKFSMGGVIIVSWSSAIVRPAYRRNRFPRVECLGEPVLNHVGRIIVRVAVSMLNTI
jgi:hypothetical protein